MSHITTAIVGAIKIGVAVLFGAVRVSPSNGLAELGHSQEEGAYFRHGVILLLGDIAYCITDKAIKQ